MAYNTYQLVGQIFEPWTVLHYIFVYRTAPPALLVAGPFDLGVSFFVLDEQITSCFRLERMGTNYGLNSASCHHFNLCMFAEIFPEISSFLETDQVTYQDLKTNHRSRISFSSTDQPAVFVVESICFQNYQLEFNKITQAISFETVGWPF